MTHSQHVILKHLDEPIRILSFSIQDLLVSAIPFFLGALVDSMLLITLTGLLAIFFIKKALKKFPKFYFIRYLYWHVPTSRYNKLFKTNLPPSHKRFFVR